MVRHSRNIAFALCVAMWAIMWTDSAKADNFACYNNPSPSTCKCYITASGVAFDGGGNYEGRVDSAGYAAIPDDTCTTSQLHQGLVSNIHWNESQACWNYAQTSNDEYDGYGDSYFEGSFNER